MQATTSISMIQASMCADGRLLSPCSGLSELVESRVSIDASAVYGRQRELSKLRLSYDCYRQAQDRQAWHNDILEHA